MWGIVRVRVSSSLIKPAKNDGSTCCPRRSMRSGSLDTKNESENSSSYQSFFVETTLYAAKLVEGKVRKYTRYQEEIKSAKPSAFNYTLQTGTGISVVRKHGLKGKNLNFGRK